MSTVKLRRSSTPGKIPTDAQLDLGEVAINTYDGKMFFKQDANGSINIIEVAKADDYLLSVDSNTTLSGDGTVAYPLSLSLSGVSANTYGTSTKIPQITVDQYGRITNTTEFDLTSIADFTYNSNTATLKIDTPDGSSFTANIDLTAFSNTNVAFAGIDLNSGELNNVSTVNFDTTHVDVPDEGHLCWNANDGTLNLGLTGNTAILQVGQENVFYVKNNTANTIPNGTVVGITGAQSGRILIEPFIADGTFLAGQIGGVTTEDISTGALGYVTTFGSVRGIDTSSYSVGSFLYASANTAGEFVDLSPTSPNLKVIIGIVTDSAVDGEIAVRPDFTPISSDITYDNTDSDLVSTNVKGGLDELDLKKVNITSLNSSVTLFSTTANSDVTGYDVLTTSTTDSRYNDVAVNVPTGVITTANQVVGELISDAGIIEGSPGNITITTLGAIRRISGSGTAEFFFRIFKRDSSNTEIEIGESATTTDIVSTSFKEFDVSVVLEANTTFTTTDRIVLKYYANRIAGGSNPSYEFRFGGNSPVRTLLPIPINAVPSDSANDILTDTSTFNTLLDETDTTVQSALETLDDHTHTTNDISEGSNLYYTIARANTAIDNRLTGSVIDILNVDNIRLDGNTLSSTDTNGNILLSPNGTGSISVESSKILNLSSPSVGTDAANKDYVDNEIGNAFNNNTSQLTQMATAFTNAQTRFVEAHAFE